MSFNQAFLRPVLTDMLQWFIGIGRIANSKNTIGGINKKKIPPTAGIARNTNYYIRQAG